MYMNDFYKDIILSSQKSLYKISHETGIPYTVLNELQNDKKNINNIAAETVFKLCLYFKCDISELLNPFSVLKNSQGIYRGIKYKWLQYDIGIELHIWDNNEDVILTRIIPSIPRWYDLYSHDVLEMNIDKYLEEKTIKGLLL